VTGSIVQTVLDDGVVCVGPQGRLDTFNVPAFEMALTEQLDAGHMRIVVDLAEVTYVSSSGLRALLSARRRARSGGGDVVLCNMAPRVREIFEMVGFVSLFNIFASVEEAVDMLQDGVSQRT
jgi:anti-anti-sigma factor